jgi:hypothetical protein
MVDIALRLDGERLIQLRFQRLEAEVHDRFARLVRELTDELYQRVTAAEPVRTGRLRARTRERFRDTPNRITGSVTAATRRADAAKAAALEYGAHGSAAVSAYERLSGDIVSAYRRHVNIVAHRFLRDPLAQMQGEIDARFAALTGELVAEANG